jgi:hypothetical protein
MIPKRLETTELEAVYDLLAEAIDRAGEARRDLFLAKLALVLANLLGDRAQVEAAVAAALRDLPPPDAA